MAHELIRIREIREDEVEFANTLLHHEGMSALPSIEHVYVAANDDDEIVGVIRLALDEQNVAHVNPIVIYPSWRGYGVGRELIAFASETYGEIRLVSRGSSLGFYQALGFKDIAWENIHAPIVSECEACEMKEECHPVPMSLIATAKEYSARPAERKAHLRSRLQEVFQACTQCGACAPRCEVLQDANHSVGSLAEVFAAMNEDGFCAEHEQDIFAVRRCCMCDYCTQVCPEDICARETFACIRELLSLEKITTEQGFESTQVDKEWHIFSVYRAVYGIGYADIPHLEQASELSADTLFFPGCPLASYAPDLTREIYAFLETAGYKTVISEQCCGSPLRSAGYAQRNHRHKQSIVEQVLTSGVRRIVCVCPGCQKELEAACAEYRDISIEFVPLPKALHEAGVSVSEQRVIEYLKQHDIRFEGKPSIAVFDSCYDREGRYSDPVKKLFPEIIRRALEHEGTDTLCCGAGGATSLVDAEIGVRRAQRVLDEGAVATLMISNCPTCAYTFAYHQRTQGESGQENAATCNYLDLVFESGFDWDTAFNQLEGMWSGEYGAWVCQQLT